MTQSYSLNFYRRIMICFCKTKNCVCILQQIAYSFAMIKNTLLKIMLVFLTAGLFSGCASLAEQGMDAYAAGDVKMAEQKLAESIRGGDPSGWNNLGVIYSRTGRPELAKRAYQMAARYGNPTAQQNLISMGLPVPAADLKKAQDARVPLIVDALSAYGAARNQSANSNTYQPADSFREQAVTPRMIPPVSSQFKTCNSSVAGQTIATTCY